MAGRGAAVTSEQGLTKAPADPAFSASSTGSFSPPIRWHLLWGFFRRVWPVLRFLVVFGGAWYFGLPHAATSYLGDHLIKPTAACVGAVAGVFGEEPVWTTSSNGMAVRLDLGTGSLWIGDSCTPIAAWAIWVVFLVALPIAWRIRAIALPAGLAALWILNTARLSSVLLLKGAGHYDIAKVVHDQVWPWLTAIMLIVCSYILLARHGRKGGVVPELPTAKGGQQV